LIDTGADISICKQHLVSTYEIDHGDPCNISSITNTEIKSYGKINLKLQYEGMNINHPFYLTSNKLSIVTDGIIGRDLLRKFMAKIDFETFTITLTTTQGDITIPMRDYFMKNINIPPRCEIIQAISLDIEEDSVILNEEIMQGVIVANTIVPSHGIAHIKILNTHNHPVTINNFSPKIHPLNKYKILKIQKIINKSSSRKTEILKKLNLHGLDNTAKQSIVEICKKYQDIFHLENEPLSTNNFYTQSIKLNDESPVYIKNYRLPNSQIQEINNQVEKLEKENIIEPSISSYNSPLLIVPKKNSNDQKKWRLVVDFRQLNKRIMNDKFPLTRLEDVLDMLGRASRTASK